MSYKQQDIERLFGDWFRKQHLEIYISWLKLQESEYEQHKDFFKNGPSVEDKKLWHHFIGGKMYRIIEIKEFNKINSNFNIYIQDDKEK